MLIFKALFRPVDAIVMWTIGEGATPETEYIERRRRVRNIRHILYDMDIIDTKSSALLQHVSIMIAVVVILLGYSSDALWQRVLIAELFCFSIVAMLLLRCVDIMGPPFRLPPANETAASAAYRCEMLIRRAVYQTVVRMVFVLTLLLVGLLALKPGVFT